MKIRLTTFDGKTVFFGKNTELAISIYRAFESSGIKLIINLEMGK